MSYTLLKFINDAIGIAFILAVLFSILKFLYGFIIWFSNRKGPERKKLAKHHMYRAFLVLGITIVMWILLAIVGILLSPYTISSFSSGTLVQTIDGFAPIESLQVGDTVRSFNLDTRQVETATIKDTFMKRSTTYYLLNQSVRVTGEHPFAVKRSEGDVVWKKAKELQIGDRLVSDSEQTEEVRSISLFSNQEAIDVYNIHVSGSENYFILLNGIPVLVHNKIYL